jgi:hypothetical protein
MSYRDAADVLVAAIKAIPESVLETKHIGGRFHHDHRVGSPGYVGGNRRFNLVGGAGVTDPRRNLRVIDDVDILVDYVAGPGHNAFEVDVAIRTDYAQIVKRLENTANYQPTICVIYPTTDARFPYSIDEVESEEGAQVRRLTISIAVEHLALN